MKMRLVTLSRPTALPHTDEGLGIQSLSLAVCSPHQWKGLVVTPKAEPLVTRVPQLGSNVMAYMAPSPQRVLRKRGGCCGVYKKHIQALIPARNSTQISHECPDLCMHSITIPHFNCYEHHLQMATTLVLQVLSLR